VTRRALVHMKGAVMMTRHPHVTRCHLQHLPKVERELETSNDAIGAGSTSHRPPLLLRHVAKLEDPQLEVGLDRLGDISGGAAGFADLQGEEGRHHPEPHIACMDTAAASHQKELSS